MPDGGYSRASALTASVPDGHLVLVVGMPRSGTSWLAKIIDSHPDVLYRHEPDIVLRNDAIPRICPKRDWGLHAGEARTYLSQLTQIRTLKAAGSLPLFRKSGQDLVRYWTRCGLTFGMKASETLFSGGWSGGWLSRVSVPDCFRKGHVPSRVVIKSVSSLGRIGLFSSSLPSSKTIVIIRHPCGQIASAWRGLQTGKFQVPDLCTNLLQLPRAPEIGITEASLLTMSPLERMAAQWALLNQKALDDLHDLPNRKVIRYEDLCTAPEQVSRDLFSFVGLPWHPRTAGFLIESTKPGAVERYYQIRRDPARAMQRWRSQLTTGEQRQIMEIVTALPVGRMFVEENAASLLAT
jgi:hypothetical protein